MKVTHKIHEKLSHLQFFEISKSASGIPSTFWIHRFNLNYFFVVMSFPAEGVESAFKNHIDEVRSYLESRHKDCYAVYNLSQRSYRATKFENRVRENPCILTLCFHQGLPVQTKLLSNYSCKIGNSCIICCKHIFYEFFFCRFLSVVGQPKKLQCFQASLQFARTCICGFDRIPKISVWFTA